MDFETLADELIELCCGTHSPGMVYRYLLEALDHDERAGKTEFVKFLRGELSERLLTEARRSVEADRRRCAPAIFPHPSPGERRQRHWSRKRPADAASPETVNLLDRTRTELNLPAAR
jgi:hypothetical protein